MRRWYGLYYSTMEKKLKEEAKTREDALMEKTMNKMTVKLSDILAPQVEAMRSDINALHKEVRRVMGLLSLDVQDSNGADVSGARAAGAAAAAGSADVGAAGDSSEACSRA